MRRVIVILAGLSANPSLALAGGVDCGSSGGHYVGNNGRDLTVERIGSRVARDTAGRRERVWLVVFGTGERYLAYGRSDSGMHLTFESGSQEVAWHGTNEQLPEVFALIPDDDGIPVGPEFMLVGCRPSDVKEQQSAAALE